MDEVENPDIIAPHQPTVEKANGLDDDADEIDAAIAREREAIATPDNIEHEASKSLSIETSFDRDDKTNVSELNDNSDTTSSQREDDIAEVDRAILAYQESSHTGAASNQFSEEAVPAADSPSAIPSPQDSLTLAELRRLREGFPAPQVIKHEIPDLKTVYDFDYQDAQPFPVEIDEWFVNNETDTARLESCAAVHKQLWTAHASQESPPKWVDSADKHHDYMHKLISTLESSQSPETIEQTLQATCYLALGVWRETAGLPAELSPNDEPLCDTASPVHADSSLQVSWMQTNVLALLDLNVAPLLCSTLLKVIDRDLIASSCKTTEDPVDHDYADVNVSLDVWAAMTILYVMLEVGRLQSVIEAQDASNHNNKPWHHELLNLCTKTVSRLRWDIAAPIPQAKILLLQWKALLAAFGGIKDVARLKDGLGDPDKSDQGPLITASPLDYHLYRQEITSKYPAYAMPRPIFDFEPDNNSMLPPLGRRRPGGDIVESQQPENNGRGINSNSIMHQPVHIATPAPSPPPSPLATGKGAKKQNYQTNQMMPLMYPPLYEFSNDLGGKGLTEVQDALVGRKWQGSDVPVSIIEAADLFVKRMHATRAMKQLWAARVEYMKYERGWQTKDTVEPGPHEDDDSPLAQDLKLASTRSSSYAKIDQVKDFYRQSLPHLQSTVTVLLKAMMKNVAILLEFAEGADVLNGPQDQTQNETPESADGSSPNKTQHDAAQGHYDPGESVRYHKGLQRTFSAAEEANVRAAEISAKALSATILLMLKWFKVAHILYYEYLTQLLVDANYIPLTIQLWQSQQIGRLCHFQLESSGVGFFDYCQSQNEYHILPRKEVEVEADEDSAPDEQQDGPSAQEPANETVMLTKEQLAQLAVKKPKITDYRIDPVEIDELGYQITQPLLEVPRTDYSWRNIFTTINHLRILQKVTRGKAHRSLLLVSYKSSSHLREILKVPVEMLRYYTLKLFKNQVPYCGRKWRQSNMKIVTAVWLSVRAELRDDWLSGGGGGMGGAGLGDIDGTVEEAMPLECSMRSLTYWYNVRHFPDVMGADKGLVNLERGFFENELRDMPRLDLNDAEKVVDDEPKEADFDHGRADSLGGIEAFQRPEPPLANGHQT